jgi:hypothetical protein
LFVRNRNDPTPEQIRELCQQIQETWTEVQRESRRVGPKYEVNYTAKIRSGLFAVPGVSGWRKSMNPGYED